MDIQLKTPSLILGVALVVAAGTLGFLLGKAALSTKALERTVVVKGLSEREVPADIATWPIRFQVAANDLEEVYALIETHSSSVRQFLAGHGIWLIALFTIATFVNRQDAIDHWHGANEDN